MTGIGSNKDSKNTMNKEHMIAVLYFIEEALSFRLGLHWLRRYLEHGDEGDLIRLIITVCREKIFDYDQWSAITDGHVLKISPTEAITKIRKHTGQKTLLDLLERADDFPVIISEYFESKVWAICDLIAAIQMIPSINWVDALSRNQIKSKLWLLEKMDQQGWLRSDSKLLLVGGWVGILPLLLAIKDFQVEEIVNIDLDVTVHTAARRLNDQSGFSFRSIKADIRSLDMAHYKDYIIVDTIVEHFADHRDWLKTLPSSTRVVLQGNDMFGLDDHVNCHDNLYEFEASCDLPVIHYRGFKELHRCNRFMLLGETL